MTLRTAVKRGAFRVAAVLAPAVLIASGCGFLSSGPDESASQGSETTIASAAPNESSEEASKARRDADWSTDPQDPRERIGEQFTYSCPAGGSATSIWGVETYTDDSSVCTAAVRVGLLSLADGGEVTIEIAGSLDSYAAGFANDLESQTWGRWGGSFVFPAALPGTGSFDLIINDKSWAVRANSLNLELGDTQNHWCAPQGSIGVL